MRRPIDAPRLAALAFALGLAACDSSTPSQPAPEAAPHRDAVEAQRAEAERAQAAIDDATAEQARAKAALAAELGEAAKDAPAEAEAAAPAKAPARYRPVLLDEAPAATSIAPGAYLCKISREYKLRPCTVELDERGHAILTMPEALLSIEGVLYDEGDVVHFDGWTMEERPFGCFNCAPRCAADPSSCECNELPPAASAHCVAQPVSFDLKRSGKGWKGTLRYALYGLRYEGTPPTRRPTGYMFEVEAFAVEIQPAKAAQ